MGQALAQWIEGSLSTLGGIEGERDRQAAQLEATRRTAASQRNAIAELDREVAKLTDERKQHALELGELDRQIAAGTDALGGLEADLAMMAAALEKVADSKDHRPKARPASVVVAGAPRPAASSTPKPSPALRPAVNTASTAPANAAAIPFPIVDSPSDSLMLTKRSPWRRVAGAAVILGVLAGGGYAALQTETGATVYDNVRTQIQGALGSTGSSNV